MVDYTINFGKDFDPEEKVAGKDVASVIIFSCEAVLSNPIECYGWKLLTEEEHKCIIDSMCIHSHNVTTQMKVKDIIAWIRARYYIFWEAWNLHGELDERAEDWSTRELARFGFGKK